MASSLAHYYSEDNSDPLPSVFEPAQAAFDQALIKLKQRSTSTSKKRRHVFEATNLGDIVDAVAAAQNRYENEHMKSKTRRCITKLSKRICYYSQVMDVLVQHHPEYVSLAWGAMKLVFGAVVEHENLGRTIITGLCDVADALPRVEIATCIYPTNAVKQAVSILYAHIIKFLLRALEWYEEGKIAHAIHSITKPAALRYDDPLEDIGRATRRIADLAVTSSQAEQRDMHHELRALTLLFNQFKKDVTQDQSIKASTLLECRHALSDIQLTQALTLVSLACSVNHKSSLQESLLIRDRHRFVSHRSKCPPFWKSPKLHAWNVSQHSSLITLRAPFKNRFNIRDFCTNIIEQLRNARIAVLWILKPREQTCHSVIEVLKSLVHQTLILDHASHTDSMFNFQLHKFQDAHFENDYVNLLGSSLRHFKLVYIIVEARAMNPAGASRCEEHLQELSRRLSEHDSSTVVKIMTLSYGPDTQPRRGKKDSIMLKVGKMSHRKGKKLPSEPLQSVANSGRQQMRRGCLGPGLAFRARGRAVRAAAD